MHIKTLISILKKRKKKKQSFKQFINVLNKSEIRALKKVVFLFLNNKLKISKQQLKKIKKHKVPLRKIIYSKPKKTFKQDKQLIIQAGGSIFSLIPAAISLLSNVFK